MWFLGPHKFDAYLHILTLKKDSSGSDDTFNSQPWQGITGRVKQETSRMLKEVKSNTEQTKLLETEVKAVQAQTCDLSEKLDKKVDQLQSDMQRDICELTTLVKSLVDRG